MSLVWESWPEVTWPKVSAAREQSSDRIGSGCGEQPFLKTCLLRAQIKERGSDGADGDRLC